MYKKHIRPKADTLLFIVFLDVFFILIFGNVENKHTTRHFFERRDQQRYPVVLPE